MNKKEVKEMWQDKTAGELKANINYRENGLDMGQELIKQYSLELANLDIDSKNYLYILKELSAKIKDYAKEVETSIKDIKLLKDFYIIKKEEEDKNNDFEKYCNKNKFNIEILENKISDLNKEAYNWKWVIKDKEIEIDKKDIDIMFQDMKNELLNLIKDNAGNIKEVDKLDWNNHKGFDCEIKGDKAEIVVNTIIAGGYNIQKLHYRTLVYKTQY